MKLVTLNIWSGKTGDTLLNFFKTYKDVDVFLLQEMCHKATERTNWDGDFMLNAYEEIGKVLSDHKGFYSPALWEEWGLTAFVKKNIQVRESGDIFVHGYKDALEGRDGRTIGKNLQYLEIMNNTGEQYSVYNFHGLWNGQGKTDTEDRIKQSKKVIDFIQSRTGKVILAGDFNLLPDTESFRMIEQELGLRNLVSEYGVTSTRTSYYTKPDKFADYILLSPDIEVKDFKVLPDEVSDHAALYLAL